MEAKIFKDNKITIRKVAKSDLRNASKFQVFINSLIDEEAKILMNKRVTLKDQKEYIARALKGAKNKSMIQLVAECDNKIVGTANIELDKWRRNHIGNLGITIIQEYRGMGLGKHLISEVIKLAKKELDPKPKIIQLEVYANNKPAIGLYKKMGFKQIAKLPNQIQYKGKLIGEYIMIKVL